MRTRAKLLLGTLGIVTATTGLALWQNQPLRLETVGRRILALDSAQVLKITWLSSREIIAFGHRKPQAQQIDLASGVGHALPVFSGVDPHSYNASPDGKWLLAEEHIDKTEQLNLLLFHPDGTDLRRFPLAAGTAETQSFWRSDSSGWETFWIVERGRTFGKIRYSLDPKQLPQKNDKIPDPWILQVQVGIEKVVVGDSAAALPCFANELPCTVPFPAVPGQAMDQTGYLSPDRQHLLLKRKVPVSLPERETWEVLLKRELPIAHQELWKLSRTGKPRLLLREAVTKKQESTFSVESISPDGTRALVQNAEGAYYLLKL